MTDTVLSAEQIESFVAHGYVRIPECFTREDAQPWLDEAWVRLGYDRDDPSTWVEQRVHMPSLRHVEVCDFAPKVWGAACELLGGEGASSSRTRGATASSPTSASEPIAHGSRRRLVPGLAQGRRLLPPLPRLARAGTAHDRAVVGHRGARRRHVHRARLRRPRGPAARAAPRGRPARRLPLRRADRAMLDFVETTGRLGDVVLMHPYMLHAVSQNHRGTARFITNPPIALERADALRPRRPRRALPGRARRAARPRASSGWTTGPRPLARTWYPSACAARSACASRRRPALAEAAS